MIRALIFDLDNTLIDRQRAVSEMLEREFSKVTADKNLISCMVKDIILWDKNGEVSRDITFIIPLQKNCQLRGPTNQARLPIFTPMSGKLLLS